MDELEKLHLLSFMACEFGTRAKLENRKRVVKMDWAEFQKVALYFYQLGKDSYSSAVG